MKTKLTVTVDQELLPKAKRAARRRGTSLSRVIENFLRDLAAEETDFVGKWRGSFEIRESSDPRIRYVMEKYLADTD